MSDHQEPNRRHFLKVAAILGIGGAVSAGIGIPGIAYVVEPAVKQVDNEEWIHLGSTSKVQLGTPTLFSAKIETKTGWVTNIKEILVYVYTENGHDYIALSNICTHLGCRVRWIDDQQKFFCPCHNGVFDKQGNVLSGPPPRPLDQYEVKIDQNEVLIKAG